MGASKKRDRQVAGFLPPSWLSTRTPPAYSLTAFKSSATDQKFDPESGQVFSETEVRPSRSSQTDWIREFSTPRVVTKPVPNSRGARSLGDIARTKVVHKFHILTPEHFETVRWAVAEKIWDIVLKTYEPFHNYP